MHLIPRRDPVPVTLGASGVAAFASRHASDWSMSSRTEPWHKILLVLSGSGHLECPDTNRALHDDLVVLIPAGTTHRLSDHPGAAVSVAGFCLDPQRLATACGSTWPVLAQRLAHGLPCNRATREAALRLIGDILANTRRDVVAELSHWGRLLSLLASLAHAPVVRRATIPQGGGVDHTLRWLDDHLAQPISVTELAARAGLSYRAFTNHVRRRTGESVLGRIVRLRLERSALLLRSGMPVIDVALACGFGDLSGFYRHFRTHFSMTPGAYRAHHGRA